MKTIVIATNNKNKVREFKSILDNDNIEFKTLKEIGFDKDIVEDGKSFKENAMIKAMTVARERGHIAISDDSGLCVDALNGAPGIYSARYAGTGDDEDNNALLLKNLKGIENRKSHYVCAICVAYPDGTYITEEGTVEGLIIDERRGKGGFGYDPYFFIPEFNATFAEVPLEKKNTISHRQRALKKIKERLDENFNIIR